MVSGFTLEKGVVGSLEQEIVLDCKTSGHQDASILILRIANNRLQGTFACVGL